MNYRDAIIRRLETLISIDTSIGVNNELEAARCIDKEFEVRRIPTQVVVPQADRGSVYARIEGESVETLLILTHLDTVGFMKGADKKLTKHAGLYFGRGALDCKGIIAVWMQVIFDLLHEFGKPKKTLAFIAAADEESGGALGTGWLVENTKCFHDVFLVIGEGGGYAVRSGDQWYFTLQTGEIEEETESSEDGPIQIIQHAMKSGYYNVNTLEYFLDCNNFVNKRCVSRESFHNNIGGFILNHPETQVLNRYYDIFETALKEMCPDWKLLPVISPGYSDNRYPRSKGIDTIGFFPLHPSNYTGGIHGRFECISEQSVCLSYRLLKKITQSIAY